MGRSDTPPYPGSRWRVRAAKGARLESVCGGNPTVGSNPTATASAKGLSLLGPFVLSVRRFGFGRRRPARADDGSHRHRQCKGTQLAGSLCAVGGRRWIREEEARQG